MIVHGLQITPEQERACLERMRKEKFIAAQITVTAINHGVPNFLKYNFIANRVADRLIQRERKAGSLNGIH